MRKVCITTAILLCAGVTISEAQWFGMVGGRGLPHLNTAWTLPRGQFTVHGFGSSYYQTAVVRNPGEAPRSATFWDVQGAVGAHFASGQHLEWALTQVFYQDTHLGSGYNLPDDLFMRVMFGSYGGKVMPLKFGVTASGRIPVGEKHNVLLEPYSGGGVELGLMGMVSYSPDLLIPENAFNLHMNVGYLHHNDVGKRINGLSNDLSTVFFPSRELLWGIGIAFPTTQFDYSFEFYGRTFVERPPVTAYAREDQIYFSPTISYRPNHWAAFHAGFDIRVSSDDELTDFSSGLERINADLPSYPNWRANFGFSFHLNRPAPLSDKPLFVNTNGRLVPRQKSLENQLNVEQERTASAEEELEKIRKERMQMETMLSRLRTLLYEGKDKDTKKEEKASTEENQPPKGSNGDSSPPQQ